ncbi:MAG: ORF6C domain-containing protein [Candidatus Competibacter sp.]|jgi:hypothetical protein|nr:ORF6C domain-containing protein [Candidatus Competibacteraceae bacterium]
MNDEEKKAEVIRLFEDLTEPAPPPSPPTPSTITINGDGNVIGNGNTVVNTGIYRPKIRIEYHPDERHIAQEQAATLKRLVEEIVNLEKRVKQRPKGYGVVWSSLNQRFKVNSYVLIARDDYPAAEKYLRMWIGRLSSGKSAHYKDPDWRDRKRRFIFANTKGALDGRRRAYMLERFATDRFNALDDAQVAQLYHAVAGWKADTDS